MSEPIIPRSDVVRTDPIQCPFCEETTMPNPLPDGSVVCSCTAERALPMGKDEGLPLLADDPGFAPAGGGVDAQRGVLPPDKGQFGTDIATEDYEPLPPPPPDGKIS